MFLGVAELVFHILLGVKPALDLELLASCRAGEEGKRFQEDGLTGIKGCLAEVMCTL